MSKRERLSLRALERKRDRWLDADFENGPSFDQPSQLDILARDPETGKTTIRGDRGDVVELIVHKIPPDPKLYVRCHPVFSGEKLMIEFQLEYDRAEDQEPMLEAFDTEKEAVERQRQLIIEGLASPNTLKMFRVHRIQMRSEG